MKYRITPRITARKEPDDVWWVDSPRAVVTKKKFFDQWHCNQCPNMENRRPGAYCEHINAVIKSENLDELRA